MAGLAKTLALVYFFCLAYPQHGIAWNGLYSPPPRFVPFEYNQGCPGGSTVPFCGDSSSTTVLKCCDVVAHSAPPDFHAAVEYYSSCADLTCQLCSAPSAGGSVSASRLICAVSSLHHEKQCMSTATKIALLAGGIILVLIVVLGLMCHMNLRICMGTVVRMITSNRSEQNIHVKVDSDAKAEAVSGAVAASDAAALALSASDARAMANSNANAQAILDARWYFVNGTWVLLGNQWTVHLIDGPGTPLPDHWRRALPQPDGAPIPSARIIEEIGSNVGGGGGSGVVGGGGGSGVGGGSG